MVVARKPALSKAREIVLALGVPRSVQEHGSAMTLLGMRD
jgi:hypothetical protein